MRLPKKNSPAFYSYCVLRLDPDQNWVVFPGIGERPVFAVREGRLAMLVSRVEVGFRADAHSIIEHGRVVHRVFEHCTVLPFRFGTTFETELHIRQLLLSNRAEFTEALNRLRAKVEMHVKVLFTGVVAETAFAGRPGVEADAPSEILRSATELVNGQYRALAEQVTVRPLQSGDWLVDFAHLIEGARVPVYQRVFTAAAEQARDCQMLVSGPWPPYHFLPSGIRMPAASEINLYSGRRMPRRTGIPRQPVAQVAKA